MDIQSLRYVVTLAEELHFGRAARQHYIAEQAFGRRVRRLEREIGVRLFDRTSRRVTLTAAGERFVARPQRVLAQVDELAEVASTEPPVGTDELRVGMLGFGLADRWPRMRELVAAQAPHLRMTYVDVDWDSQYDAVRSGAVDVSVAHDVGPAGGLVFDPVLDVGRFAVVPRHSPLAEAPRLSEDDIVGEQWIRPIGRHPGLADWAGPAGVYGSTSTLVRTPGMVPAAVATSGQLGLHGDPARWFFPHPDVRYVPLDGEHAIVSVVSREDENRPVVRAFRRAARTLASLERQAR
ncbi:MAG: LysR family transcriptional regulator [Pseudonocardiaceae bacterium]|nr:LysR family transcriptional regulator [Pseudonocardiaceae bacterium]